jgi:hypothetical protein
MREPSRGAVFAVTLCALCQPQGEAGRAVALRRDGHDQVQAAQDRRSCVILADVPQTGARFLHTLRCAQPMSEYRGFSNDGLWWWTGAAWMPTRPPDGRSATWTGSQWVASSESLGTLALSAIALGLGLVELVWAIVAVVILVSEANAQYEASGRVGTEDITHTPVSVPILVSLLIIPAIVTILTSANVRRHWWVGVLLGGWPAMVVALLALVSPGSGRLETIATMGFIVVVLIAIGWLVHRGAWRRWNLSADGQRWVRGSRSFPTVSIDGRWCWDGRTWLPADGG